MKKYISFFFSMVLMLSLWTEANSQDFSATQNWLTGVSFQTCMQRSKEILSRNGFSVTAQSDNVSYLGTKTKYKAFLLCQSCGDKTITTIVLSNSDGTNADVLREKMLNYIATGTDNTPPSTGLNLYTLKNTYAVGEKIIVEYSGMSGSPQDWIALTESSKPVDQYGPWQYTNGARSGRMTFEALPPGQYEARAYFNNSYKLEKKFAFSVTGNTGGGTGDNPPVTGKLLKLNKSKYIIGEKFSIEYFNLPGNKTDWVSIAAEGSSDEKFISWWHTNGNRSGSIQTEGLAAGNYEARAYFNNSYKLEDRIHFKVIPSPEGDFIIKVEKTVFAPNEAIKVFFSNSQGLSSDWITITQAGNPNTSYGQWFGRGALPSGEMLFKGLAPGNYEVRYFLNNGYELKKTISIQVK